MSRRRRLLGRRLLGWANRLCGALCPGRVADRAWRVWGRTWRFPVKPRERQWLAEAERPPLEYLGRPLAVYVWGEPGPTVMLVHGWNGHAGQLGGFVAPLVAAGYRVVAFDAPGHGASHGHHTDIYAYTGAIDAVAERYGPLEGLIAHSYGAVCAAMSLRVGLIVRRAVFVAAPARYQDLVERYLQGMRFHPAVQEAFRHRLFRAYGRDAWQRFSVIENVARVHTRGLVIHDRNDRIAPPDQAEAIAAAWPRAHVHWTEGLGHFRILADPAVNQVAADFIGGQD